MQERDRTQAKKPVPDLLSFSFTAAAEVLGNEPVLQTYHLEIRPGEAPESGVSLEITQPLESPDDIFSSRFGVFRNSHMAWDPQAVTLAEETLAHVVTEGLFDFELEKPQAVSIRYGGAGVLSNRIAVRWLSYQDMTTESWLLPDLNAVQAILNSKCPDFAVEVTGVERFTSAESRVLMMGEGDETRVGVLVPAACRGEALEHFNRAVAGSREPSFLYTALEEEVVRVLDGRTSVDSQEYQEILVWIRAHLRWSVVAVESCVACGAAEDSILLDLMMNDPESILFTETFGTPTLRCRVSFGSATSELVGRPSFRWFHPEES